MIRLCGAKVTTSLATRCLSGCAADRRGNAAEISQKFWGRRIQKRAAQFRATSSYFEGVPANLRRRCRPQNSGNDDPELRAVDTFSARQSCLATLTRTPFRTFSQDCAFSARWFQLEQFSQPICSFPAIPQSGEHHSFVQSAHWRPLNHVTQPPAAPVFVQTTG